MVMPKSYDDLVDKLAAEREAKKMGHTVTKLTEAETAQEIAKTTENVFVEPVPIITPTGPELDMMARTIEQTQGYMTTTGRLLKGKPGRKKGWRKVKA